MSVSPSAPSVAAAPAPTSPLTSVPSEFRSALPEVQLATPAVVVPPIAIDAMDVVADRDEPDYGYVPREPPVPFIGGGPGQSALIPRAVKMPEWKGPLFKPGQSWTAHKQLFNAQLERITGLTEQQVSHLFLDSLSPNVRILAEANQKQRGLPPLNQMIRLLDTAYPASRTTLNDEFEDQLGRLKQEEGQDLSDYLASVQLVLNKYRTTVDDFDPRRFHYLRKLAYQALSLRLNTVDNRALEAQKILWLEKGNMNPLQGPLQYDTICVWLMQRTSELGHQKPKKFEKERPMCKYDPNCTRKGCKFQHTTKNGGVSKKRAPTICSYCKKPNHTEDACYSKRNASASNKN